MDQHQVESSLLELFLAEFEPLTPRIGQLPEGFRCDAVFVSGIGGGVELLYMTGSAAPLADDLRRVWRERNGKRPVPVLAVAAYPTDAGVQADLVGLFDDQRLQRGVDLAQVERAAAAALEAGTNREAEGLLAPLFAREEDTGLPSGLRNEGLFAAWELSERVPSRHDWVSAGAQARALRGRRSLDLLAALGWKSKPLGSTGHLVGDGEEDRAVAVLLQDDELFERRSRRWGDVSPIERGLGLAHQHRMRWVVAVQGDVVRLYSASADVGVGRKGASATYTELHVAALDDARLAYVPLLVSPQALAAGGSVEQILESSADHAAGLGARLRERVYQDVVPALAQTVARRLKAGTEAELAQAYHVTLVILFRLLFVAYAEDRALLPYKSNTEYTRSALKTRARAYTDQLENGQAEHSVVAVDVWNDLTDIWRAVEVGHSDWGVPAYSGGLFSADDDRGRAVADLQLTNAEIGPALVALLVDTGKDGTRGPVDFQALSVREFGTIYEGLLESSLSIAPVALALDERENFVPAGPGDVVHVAAGQVYFHNASGARKATGSYFTKQFAVEHLLSTALEPAIDDHLARVRKLLDDGDEASAGEAFFDLRVADISMGSGHFLIGAVDHIALRMSAFLAEHPVTSVDAELRRLRDTALQRMTDVGVTDSPEIDPANLLRRQVARRCIYGVDINQIAVDLARLALWIHTFVPGLPMSSLEHGLVKGNALSGVGTLDEALEVLSAPRKARRGASSTSGQITLFEEPIRTALSTSRDLLVGVKRTAEATAAEVAEAASAYRTALAAATPAVDLLNAAVAGRLGLIDIASLSIFGPERVCAAVRAPDIQQQLLELDVLHFPAAFPEVFLRDRPGFDVILGNPPWEKIRHEVAPFWVGVDPGLMALKDAERDARVEYLRRTHPEHANREVKERARREVQQRLFKAAFVLRGGTHLEAAQLMLERAIAVSNVSRHLGLVLPRQALVLAGWREVRRFLVENHDLDLVEARNNSEWLFEDVHASYAVVLLKAGPVRRGRVLARVARHAGEVSGPLRTEAVVMTQADIRGLSDSSVIPWFNEASDVRVFDKMKGRPSLASGEGWITGTHDARWDFRKTGGDVAQSERSESEGAWSVLMTSHVDSLSFDEAAPTKQYVPVEQLGLLQRKGIEVHEGALRLARSHPLVVMRHPSRSDDTRTLIATALPSAGMLPNKGYVHAVMHASGSTVPQILALLGYMTTVTADWWARRFTDRHVTAPIVNNLRLPDWDEHEIDRAAAITSALLFRNGARVLAGGVVVQDGCPEITVHLRGELERLAARGFALREVDLRIVAEDFSMKGLPADVRYEMGLSGA